MIRIFFSYWFFTCLISLMAILCLVHGQQVSTISNYICPKEDQVCSAECLAMYDFIKKSGARSSWARRHKSLLAHYQQWGCKVAVEIGIARGELSHFFMKNVPSIEEYHAVDPFLGGYDKKDVFSNILKSINSSEVWRDAILHNMKEFGCKFRLHHGLSTVRYKDFPPESVDCLFIDGDHTFEGVKADIQLWTPIIKPGGYYIFDDVYDSTFPGVAKAMNSFAEKNHLEAKKLNEFLNYYIRKPPANVTTFDFNC